MLDVLKMLYPTSPAPPERRRPRPAPTFPSGAAAAHRAQHLAQFGRLAAGWDKDHPNLAAIAGEAAGAEKEAEEEVNILHLVERAGDAAGPAAAGGRKRRRVNGEEGAGPSRRGVAGGQPPGNGGRGASRFRGVSKTNMGKGSKPWKAQIGVTEDGKGRLIYIGTFAREEDAARAFDRVKVAYRGHAEAETNFPVADYRAEWAELEALGVDGAVALVREQAGAGRLDVMNKASRFRGVTKDKRRKAKPWQAQIQVTEDGKHRNIHNSTFAREDDAARAYDRVSIAKLGHAKAKTNFPVAEYREEWAELEALGVDGAAALMREHAAAERPDVMNKVSRFRGVGKGKKAKTKPWKAEIHLTEDGKRRPIHIGYFSREEDAVRAYDRVSIAKLGHAKAKTNFPVAEYRAEWGQLEALGVDGAAALMREHAAAERPDVMDKASRFRGVYKEKKSKIKPWMADISVTEDGKGRRIRIGTFARE